VADKKIMIIRQGYSPPVFFQQGFATLTVALMISFLATFMTLYAARVGVMAQRISANEFRAEEAFAAAEAGVEEGIAYLRGNRKQIDSWSWTSCSNEIIPPCGNGTENVYDGSWKYRSDTGNYFLRYYIDGTATSVFSVVAKGKSADGSGHAFVRQGVYFYPFKANIPDAPLMAGGTIGGTGNFSVVANPNGRGVGGSLSAWARGDITIAGSASTTLSDKNLENTDILDKDEGKGVNPDTTNFPDDIFEYLFGIPNTEWQAVKDEATVLASCGALNGSSSGLYWTKGNCAPSNNIGSPGAPVLLVVQDGALTVHSNLEIYGLIFAFSSSPDVQLSVDLNGTSTIHGAVVSNQNIDFGGGNFKMLFDSTVLGNLYSNVGGRGLGLIPGSWADY
jgi:Tfp pilus assembly protein PilX